VLIKLVSESWKVALVEVTGIIELLIFWGKGYIPHRRNNNNNNNNNKLDE
jgi:hypothetical protein